MKKEYKEYLIKLYLKYIVNLETKVAITQI